MLDCVFSRWSPGIGDPTIGGWLTVVVYIAAGLMAYMRLQTAIRERERYRAIERTASIWQGPMVRFWAIMFVGLVVLGINKQLDLQSFVTAAGKCAARAQGWYDNRRVVQVAFLGALGVIGVTGSILGVSMLRGALRKNAMVLAGVGLLLVFILARAASFHDFDVFINWRFLGLKMNWIIEIGALSLIIFGAWRTRGGQSGEPNRS